MKITIPVLTICISLLLQSCSIPSPQQYFDQAALNCNILYGFAGYELKRDLATPAEKLVDEKTWALPNGKSRSGAAKIRNG